MIQCPSCQIENDDDSDNCIACGKGLYALTRGAVLSGRYEILDAIGKGGMGVVYKARDLDLDETVALKVMRGDVTGSSDGARRFRSEIKLARKVTHPNVCRIHDYSRQGHLTYIAMEFIAGTDLKQELRRRGPFPPTEALDLILQVARGLEAVHRQGVVHRDLKTPNIMRMADGTAKLMDFGIAKSFGGDTATGVTGTGLIVGTPEYMSPEQARAEAVDARTDIYALGIVLFELLTGELPFHGETPLATLMNHMQQPPPLEGPRAARIPPQVVPALRRSLAKDRAERYASVHEMTVELERAQETLLAELAARAECAAADTLAGMDLDVTTPLPTPVPKERSARAQAPPAPSPVPRVTTPPATPRPSAITPPPVPVPSVITPPAAPIPRPVAPAVVRPVPPPAVIATPPRPAARVPAPPPAAAVSPPLPAAELPASRSRHQGPPSRRLSWVVWAGGSAVVVVAVVGVAIIAGLLGGRETLSPATSLPPRPEATLAPTPTPASVAVPRVEPSALDPAPVAPAAKTPRAPALAKAVSTAPFTLPQAPTPTPRPTAEPSQPTRPPTLALKPDPALVSRAEGAPPPSGAGSNATSPSSVTAAPGPAPVAVPESTGIVRIGVKPYAEVFVDGKSVGTTPLGALTLAAGPHAFRFVHPDYQPLQRRITIRPGEVTRLPVDLTLDGIPK
jgi:eukaryotic-like serine/threonine-protein kinase